MAVSTISLAQYLIYYFLYNSDTFFCTTDSRRQEVVTCPQDDSPACALYYGSDCQDPSGFCQKTVDSKCQACFDEYVIAYLSGSCDQHSFTRCKDQSNVRCDPSQEDYVCAFRSESECNSQLYPRTVTNFCVACTYDDIFFYSEGRCKGEPTGICRPEARYPETCTEEYEPYCTYYKDGNSIYRKTTSNRCYACAAPPTAVFYVPGFCELDEAGGSL